MIGKVRHIPQSQSFHPKAFPSTFPGRCFPLFFLCSLTIQQDRIRRVKTIIAYFVKRARPMNTNDALNVALGGEGGGRFNCIYCPSSGMDPAGWRAGKVRENRTSAGMLPVLCLGVFLPSFQTMKSRTFFCGSLLYRIGCKNTCFSIFCTVCKTIGKLWSKVNRNMEN